MLYPVIIIVRFDCIRTEIICIPNPIPKPRQKTNPHHRRPLHLCSYSSENDFGCRPDRYGNVHAISRFHIYLFAQCVIFLSRDQLLLIDFNALRCRINKFKFMKGLVTNFEDTFKVKASDMNNSFKNILCEKRICNRIVQYFIYKVYDIAKLSSKVE